MPNAGESRITIVTDFFQLGQYELAARDLMDECKEMLRSERWTKEREKGDITAYSMSLPSGHTIFKISVRE